MINVELNRTTRLQTYQAGITIRSTTQTIVQYPMLTGILLLNMGYVLRGRTYPITTNAIVASSTVGHMTLHLMEYLVRRVKTEDICTEHKRRKLRD